MLGITLVVPASTLDVLTTLLTLVTICYILRTGVSIINLIQRR